MQEPTDSMRQPCPDISSLTQGCLLPCLLVLILILILCCAVPCRAMLTRRVLPGLILKGLSAVLPTHPCASSTDAAHDSNSNTISSSSGSSGVSVPLLLELREAAQQDLALTSLSPPPPPPAADAENARNAAAGGGGSGGSSSSVGAVPVGVQDLPIDLTAEPPLYWPTEKVRQERGGWWVLGKG